MNHQGTLSKPDNHRNKQTFRQHNTTQEKNDKLLLLERKKNP